MFCVGLIHSIAAATSADELKMPLLLLLFHNFKIVENANENANKKKTPKKFIDRKFEQRTIQFRLPSVFFFTQLSFDQHNGMKQDI